MRVGHHPFASPPSNFHQSMGSRLTAQPAISLFLSLNIDSVKASHQWVTPPVLSGLKNGHPLVKKYVPFCRKFNHTYTICEQRKQHAHPACWRCGSFAHQTSLCTNSNNKCILCRDAKHSARNCPLYVGTYRKAGTNITNPPPVVGKAIPPNLQARVGNMTYSSTVSIVPNNNRNINNNDNIINKNNKNIQKKLNY